jgi:hypothetical protein
MDGGKRRQFAERDVAKSIEQFIARSIFPGGFERGWFESLLAGKSRTDEPPRLKDVYTKKRIKLRHLRELAAQPRVGIPPLNDFLPTAKPPGL